MKYALVLNDMRSSNIENVHAVKVSSDRNELIAWYNDQLAEKPYTDGNWQKTFKKGSPLEWMNPGNLEENNSYFGGIYTFKDEATDEQIMEFSLYKR